MIAPLSGIKGERIECSMELSLFPQLIYEFRSGHSFSGADKKTSILSKPMRNGIKQAFS